MQIVMMPAKDPSWPFSSIGWVNLAMMVAAETWGLNCCRSTDSEGAREPATGTDLVWLVPNRGKPGRHGRLGSIGKQSRAARSGVYSPAAVARNSTKRNHRWVSEQPSLPAQCCAKSNNARCYTNSCGDDRSEGCLQRPIPGDVPRDQDP